MRVLSLSVQRWILAAGSLVLTSPVGAQASSHAAAHWSYHGSSGPTAWAKLDHAYAACGTGHAQSPIDISAPASRDLPNVDIHYQPTRLNVLNNGHTIQVTYDSGSYVEVGGTRYNLVQFHFHAPSEHTIGKKPAAAELHLVHSAADGRLAVIGVLIERGQENGALAPLWAHLPAEAGPAQQIAGSLNAADLLPARRTTYRYDGSLTTPPCTEGVRWLVMTTPITVSDQQLASLKAVLHANNRPVQPLHNRVVTEDATP